MNPKEQKIYFFLKKYLNSIVDELSEKRKKDPDEDSRKAIVFENCPGEPLERALPYVREINKKYFTNLDKSYEKGELTKTEMHNLKNEKYHIEKKPLTINRDITDTELEEIIYQNSKGSNSLVMVALTDGKFEFENRHYLFYALNIPEMIKLEKNSLETLK